MSRRHALPCGCVCAWGQRRYCQSWRFRETERRKRSRAKRAVPGGRWVRGLCGRRGSRPARAQRRSGEQRKPASLSRRCGAQSLEAPAARGGRVGRWLDRGESQPIPASAGQVSAPLVSVPDWPTWTCKPLPTLDCAPGSVELATPTRERLRGSEADGDVEATDTAWLLGTNACRGAEDQRGDAWWRRVSVRKSNPDSCQQKSAGLLRLPGLVGSSSSARPRLR